jgi:formylglycine-generating enzyme required for sulfatase activity
VAAVLTISIVAGLVFRHAAAIQRQQSLQREVITAVDAMQNATGPIVSYGLRDLQKLPDDMVLDGLKSRYSSAEVNRKLGLAYALAEYGEPDAPFLYSQIQNSAPEEVDNFISAFRQAQGASLEAIHTLAKEAEAEQNWRLKTRLAVVALHLEDDRIAADMCRIDERPDPIQRTLFIDEVATWHGNVAPLAVSCRAVADPALRSGLCLALGSMPSMSSDRSSDSGKEAWKSVLAEWYETAPDTATHSAAGWALRQWQTELPGVSAPSQPSENRKWFVNSLGVTMLKIHPGGFDRVDVEFDVDGNTKQTVKLTRPFFLADREVSIDQFQKFIDDPDCKKEDKPADWQQASVGVEGDHPREAVSWYDAVLFCNWLSRKEGLASCYERTGNKVNFQNIQNHDFFVLPEGEYDEWQLLQSGTGYRLPTVAEWEYACRAGTTTDFACGNDADLLRKYAVYTTGNIQGAAACGSKLPNGWGLFDMHGNVWEWCYDKYGSYGEGNVTDPAGPSEGSGEGSNRVYRGGDWCNDAANCRSGVRYWDLPVYRLSSNGFRPVLSSVQPVK